MKKRQHSAFLFLLSYYKQVFFSHSTQNHIFGFLLEIILFKRVLKHSAEVLSPIPNYEKAVMCLLKNICMLVKLYSIMSYGAVLSHEFAVNGLNIKYIKYVSLNRNSHKTKLCVGGLMQI